MKMNIFGSVEVNTLVGLWVLEAILAMVNPGQFQLITTLADVMSSFIPAVANIPVSTLQGQNARNFIAVVFVLLPLKGWITYRVCVYRQDEAFGNLVVTPRSGRSAGYGVLVLMFLVTLFVVLVPEIWFFGPPQSVNGQIPDIAQSALYSRTMKNGLSMWGIWSMMFASGMSLLATLIVWSIRDWVVYLRGKN